MTRTTILGRPAALFLVPFVAALAGCSSKPASGTASLTPPFLETPPRDLTGGQFKFRTTSSGQLPTDEDLFRTISRGADGTGMPPWAYLLADDDRWALVDYVKSFDSRFVTATAL